MVAQERGDTPFLQGRSDVVRGGFKAGTRINYEEKREWKEKGIEGQMSRILQITRDRPQISEVLTRN